MAMHLLIDGKNEQGQPVRKEITQGAAAAWVFARTAAVFSLFGRMAAQAFERIKNAQGSAGKRKQMQLVESLALGNRRQLLLVVCNNQRYLVGAGADSVGSILAIEGVPASRDQPVKGPELVRRRGREVAHEARSKLASQAGMDLWP